MGHPCTWNLVLITSSGHTKVAAITPAEAPAAAWARALRAEVEGWWWLEEDAAGSGGTTAAVAGEVATSPGISPDLRLRRGRGMQVRGFALPAALRWMYVNEGGGRGPIASASRRSPAGRMGGGGA